jgi:hypothetical protein
MRSHSSGDQGVSLCLSRDCMGHQHWLASVSLSDPVNVYLKVSTDLDFGHFE